MNQPLTFDTDLSLYIGDVVQVTTRGASNGWPGPEDVATLSGTLKGFIRRAQEKDDAPENSTTALYLDGLPVLHLNWAERSVRCANVFTGTLDTATFELVVRTA